MKYENKFDGWWTNVELNACDWPNDVIDKYEKKHKKKQRKNFFLVLLFIEIEIKKYKK